MTQRNKIGMVVAEFFGTALLTSVVLAQLNMVGAIMNSPWFVAVSAGLTLAVMTGVIGRVSGCHINPAVTIGLFSLRKIPATNVVVYIVSQVFGGIMALALFQYLTDTTVAAAVSGFDWRIFLAEVVGTVVFTFGIAAAVLQNYEGFRLAFVIGSSLTLGIIVAAVASSGILNPAVAIGLNSWNLTYVLAPVIGSVLGMNLYALFLAPLPEVAIPAKKKKK